MIQVLYNSSANNGQGFESAKKIEVTFPKQKFEYVDVLKEASYDELFKRIPVTDSVVIAGGDGTLNYFVNHVSEEIIRDRVIDYLPAGTGNDFATELGVKEGQVLKNINKYLVNLPTVTVKGKKYKFINGIGYGIDGYCCEVGDELRKTSTKKINYAGIAIKGILFHFKPLTAKVSIDQTSRVFKNTWLTPCMNGRYYGGGMIPTPDQQRLGEPKKLSVMVYHCKSKLTALTVFPSIFKGEHVKHNKVVNILTGQKVSVKFDRPCALQIDGETISGVTEFDATV